MPTPFPTTRCLREHDCSTESSLPSPCGDHGGRPRNSRCGRDVSLVHRHGTRSERPKAFRCVGPTERFPASGSCQTNRPPTTSFSTSTAAGMSRDRQSRIASSPWHSPATQAAEYSRSTTGSHRSGFRWHSTRPSPRFTGSSCTVPEAGGESTLRVFDDVPHGWQLLDDLIPEARSSLAEAASFIRQSFSAKPEATSAGVPAGSRP